MGGVVGEGPGESPSMKHGAIPVSEQASPKWTILEGQAGRRAGGWAGGQAGIKGSGTARWSDPGKSTIVVFP